MSVKKPKKKPVFDYQICMACKDCLSCCPESCLAADKTDVDSYQKAYPQLSSDRACTGCAICAKDCPVDAIEMV